MPEPVGASRRSTLSRVERAILDATGNRWERVVALAADGSQLLAKDGTADELHFTEAELALLSGHVDLLIHNHPSGLSFSRDDVRSGVALGARELVVCGAARRFRLRRRRADWPPARLLAAETDRVWQEVVSEFLRKIAAGRLTRADAMASHHDVVWRRVAARFPGEVAYTSQERR